MSIEKSPKVEDLILHVSIIVSLEQIGPILKATTSEFLDNSQKEAKVILYFTQRVVFTLGIGNQQVKFDKFHGPIELIDLPNNQEIILYPKKMIDKESSDSRIQRFGRDIIVCIHYKAENRAIIASFQEVLYAKLTELFTLFVPNNDYSLIRTDEKLKNLVFTFREKLNRFLNLRIEAKRLGESLFNLSALRQLEEKKREIGSLLLGNLKGLTKTEILSNTNSKYPENEYMDSLIDLIEMGYVIQETKDDTQIFRLRD